MGDPRGTAGSGLAFVTLRGVDCQLMEGLLSVSPSFFYNSVQINIFCLKKIVSMTMIKIKLPSVRCCMKKASATCLGWLCRSTCLLHARPSPCAAGPQGAELDLPEHSKAVSSSFRLPRPTAAQGNPGRSSPHAPNPIPGCLWPAKSRLSNFLQSRLHSPGSLESPETRGGGVPWKVGMTGTAQSSLLRSSPQGPPGE